MCSFVLKTLFLGGLVAGVVLTAIALGTSYWQVGKIVDVDVGIGLFKGCLGGKTEETKIGCGDATWKDIEPWRQAVIILLAVTLGISLFAFGWWFLACIGCCCQNFLAPPLPILALLLALLDMAAVIVYACYASKYNGSSAYASFGYGYSFWCAVAASCSFALTAIIGCGVVAMVKKGKDRTVHSRA